MPYFHPADSFTSRADETVSAVPVQERDAPALRDEVRAHLFRTDGVTIKLILEESEDVVIRADKFFAIRIRHPPQVAEHPASGLELPVISQAKKAIV